MSLKTKPTYKLVNQVYKVLLFDVKIYQQHEAEVLAEFSKILVWSKVHSKFLALIIS